MTGFEKAVCRVCGGEFERPTWRYGKNLLLRFRRTTCPTGNCTKEARARGIRGRPRTGSPRGSDGTKLGCMTVTRRPDGSISVRKSR